MLAGRIVGDQEQLGTHHDLQAVRGITCRVGKGALLRAVPTGMGGHASLCPPYDIRRGTAARHAVNSETGHSSRLAMPSAILSAAVLVRNARVTRSNFCRAAAQSNGFVWKP